MLFALFMFKDSYGRLKMSEISSGDYILVKIKANEDKPVSEQWREANGVCDDPPRREYQQALLDHDEHRQGGEDDDIQSTAMNMSLLQIALHVEWRSSSAAHARDRLPPPGNGPKRRVTFNDIVVNVTVEGNLETWKDHSISNDFVLGSIQKKENKGANEFHDDYMNKIRFEDVGNRPKEVCSEPGEHQMDRSLPLRRLPVEEEAIDANDGSDVEQDDYAHHLPILEEEGEGTDHQSGCIAQLCAEDTEGVYDLHRWLEKVKIMHALLRCEPGPMETSE